MDEFHDGFDEVSADFDDPLPERTCRVCGCTDSRACPGGCYWVQEDLCSRCAEILRGPMAAGLVIGLILGVIVGVILGVVFMFTVIR